MNIKHLRGIDGMKYATRHIVLLVLSLTLYTLLIGELRHWIASDEYFSRDNINIIRPESENFLNWKTMSGSLAAEFNIQLAKSYLGDIGSAYSVEPVLNFLFQFFQLSKLLIVFHILWVTGLQVLAIGEYQFKQLFILRKFFEGALIFILSLYAVTAYWTNKMSWLFVQLWNDDWTRILNGSEQELSSTLTWYQKFLLIPTLRGYWDGQGFNGAIKSILLASVFLTVLIYFLTYAYVKLQKWLNTKKKLSNSERPNNPAQDMLFAVVIAFFLLAFWGSFCAHRFCGPVLLSYISQSYNSDWGLTNISTKLSSFHYPVLFLIVSLSVAVFALALQRFFCRTELNIKYSILKYLSQIVLVWILFCGITFNGLIQQGTTVLEGDWNEDLTREIYNNTLRWEEQIAPFYFPIPEALRIDAFNDITSRSNKELWEGEARKDYIKRMATLGNYFEISLRVSGVCMLVFIVLVGLKSFMNLLWNQLLNSIRRR